MGLLIIGWTGALEARERPISQLPKDVIDVAFVWTEPIKEVARQSHESNPISGLCLGLLAGSVKSVQHTAEFVVSGFEKSGRSDVRLAPPPAVGSASVGTPTRNPQQKKAGPLFRYDF